MANTEPYKDKANGDRWTLDVDVDDEVFYVANVIKWLTDNSTSAVSYTLHTTGVTVLDQDPPQGPSGSLLAVKLKVSFTAQGVAYCTFRVKTADTQQFDKTMWFKKVEN